MIQGELQIRPLSVNSIWQGRRYRTSEFKAWQDLVLYNLEKQDELRGELAVKLDFYLPNAGRIDLDNLLKGIIDCFQKRGYFKNDNKITYLEARKWKSKEDNIKYKIYKI